MPSLTGYAKPDNLQISSFLFLSKTSLPLLSGQTKSSNNLLSTNPPNFSYNGVYEVIVDSDVYWKHPPIVSRKLFAFDSILFGHKNRQLRFKIKVGGSKFMVIWKYMAVKLNII